MHRKEQALELRSLQLKVAVLLEEVLPLEHILLIRQPLLKVVEPILQLLQDGIDTESSRERYPVCSERAERSSTRRAGRLLRNVAVLT